MKLGQSFRDLEKAEKAKPEWSAGDDEHTFTAPGGHHVGLEAGDHDNRAGTGQGNWKVVHMVEQSPGKHKVVHSKTFGRRFNGSEEDFEAAKTHLHAYVGEKAVSAATKTLKARGQSQATKAIAELKASKPNWGKANNPGKTNLHYDSVREMPDRWSHNLFTYRSNHPGKETQIDLGHGVKVEPKYHPPSHVTVTHEAQFYDHGNMNHKMNHDRVTLHSKTFAAGNEPKGKVESPDEHRERWEKYYTATADAHAYMHDYVKGKKA